MIRNPVPKRIPKEQDIDKASLYKKLLLLESRVELLEAKNEYETNKRELYKEIALVCATVLVNKEVFLKAIFI